MLNITHYQRNANQNHNEVPFHASQNECFYLFIFFSVTALFYLEDSRRIHPRSVRACQHKDSKRREWRSVWGGREREKERALWLLLLYVFSSTWACPMQIGLSQECCLFCLKSSLWSLDLPLTFLCFIFSVTEIFESSFSQALRFQVVLLFT